MKKKSLLGVPFPETVGFELDSNDHDQSRDKLYFIQKGIDGPIKIGMSKNPSQRLKTLQTGNTERLKLLGYISATYSDESRFHQRFSSIRIRGEWFLPKKELIDFIEELIDDTK